MICNQILIGDCLEVMRTLPDASVDLVLGSPPYAEKGQRYGDKTTKWRTLDWCNWMVDVTQESLRISRNIVVWVVNGSVRDGRYLPAVEGLIWKCHEIGIACERPVIWHKNAAPNRRDWFGNDWEYCIAFRPENSSRYFDWKAIGQPPKYKSGGHFRQRDTNGARRKGGDYPQNEIARPRDVLRVTVGGGHMGSKLAHENEAPYPEALPEVFIKSCCPAGGIVLDPFSGSGTTVKVAASHGRKWIAIDYRESQGELTARRVKEVASP